MLKDVLDKLLSNSKEKEGKLGIYFLGAIVAVCLLLSISLLTGCGKEKKEKKEADSQIEVFEVRSKVRFMPDGLGYHSVDVTFYLDDDILNDKKQLSFIREILIEDYELKEEEWEELIEKKQITISTHRD